MQLEKYKIRQSNFELMRIVSMILIIIWHIIIHCDLRNNTVGTNNMIINFIYIVFCVHVNSFVLLSGYFMCDKKPSFQKIVKLFNQTWFYKALISVIFLFFGIEKITKLEFIKEILPLNISGDYWFVNYYIILFFVTPYLNLLINSLNQHNHRKMIILFMIIFSIIPIISNNTFIGNNGCSLMNFVLLYFIGAYLHKYPIDKSYHFNFFSTNKLRIIYCFLFIFLGFFNFLLFEFSNILDNYTNSLLLDIQLTIKNTVTMFSNPLIIFQSIFYFLFFSTLNFKNNIINFFAETVIGIYLIHENHHVYNFIYGFIGFISVENILSKTLILRVILLSFAIFIICSVVEMLRLFIVKKIKSTKLSK